MLRWAILFLIVAIIAGVFGFGGIAAAATDIARLLFVGERPPPPSPYGRRWAREGAREEPPEAAYRHPARRLARFADLTSARCRRSSWR